MDTVIDVGSANEIDTVLEKFLDESGATYTLLTDMGGTLLFESGGEDIDGDTLAALSAANYAATREIATLVNKKNFSLLFHRGENENVHFSKIASDTLLIILFKPHLSLGLLRLKIKTVIKELGILLGP
jgi:predicted regulator of Ras-like GTPase activity (Roadblock/LC7/MglB family)